MLSQTIDEIMSRAKKFEDTTRATKFSSVFKTAPQMPKEEYKMQKRISRYSRKNKNVAIEQDWVMEDLIVEDPDEIKVDISYASSEGERKPFFKSLGMKLSNKLQYQA